MAGRLAPLGRQYGRLTLIEQNVGRSCHGSSRGNLLHRFRCQCGNEIVGHTDFVGGRIKSCGCLLSDTARAKQPAAVAVRRRPVVSPEGVGYGSVNEASRAAGISVQGMCGRLRRPSNGWRYGERTMGKDDE